MAFVESGPASKASMSWMHLVGRAAGARDHPGRGEPGAVRHHAEEDRRAVAGPARMEEPARRRHQHRRARPVEALHGQRLIGGDVDDRLAVGRECGLGGPPGEGELAARRSGAAETRGRRKKASSSMATSYGGAARERRHPSGYRRRRPSVRSSAATNAPTPWRTGRPASLGQRPGHRRSTARRHRAHGAQMRHRLAQPLGDDRLRRGPGVGRLARQHLVHHAGQAVLVAPSIEPRARRSPAPGSCRPGCRATAPSRSAAPAPRSRPPARSRSRPPSARPGTAGCSPA